LAEFYRGGLRIAVEPGTSFMYGDHSFATLGQIVEDVSGTTLEAYFRNHIFEPLGMVDSDLLRSERLQARLATGYKLGSSGPKLVTDRDLIPRAAGGIYSTTRDMARYVAALLGGGTNDHGTVLEPETMATMFEPHYQPDIRILGLGLAFFRGDLGGHLAIEHQGILPGFNSQIWLAPNDGVGILAFTNGARDAVRWLVAEQSRLLGDLLGAPPDAIRTDVPQHPESWSEICGWYKPSLPSTDPRYRLFFGAGAEVFVHGGQLRFRLLNPIPAFYRGFPLYPDDESDPYVFALDFSQWGIAKVRLVFSREPGGRTKSCALDFQPIPLYKQPDSMNPRVWAARALAATAAAVALGQLNRMRKRRGAAH
jgi:hypothetical protein